MVGFQYRDMDSPAKIAICSKCNKIFPVMYVHDTCCPSCKQPIFPQDLVYMPNQEDAYNIAQIIVAKKRARELGFDDDDT